MGESSEERIARRAAAARKLAGGRQPNRTYPRDRICRSEECESILSIYNAGPFCSAHGEYNAISKPRLRGRSSEGR